MTIELSTNGRIVFDPFLGPYNSYPSKSKEWHVAFSRSVQSAFDRMQFAHPKDFALLLVKAVNTDYRPWEHWPEEAQGSPDKYFRLVIGCSWDEARRLVIGQGGEEGMQWVRVIDGALQEWEAKKRKAGAPEGNQNAAREKTTVGDTYYCPSWDATEARGIRRRLQKRAIAGDDQAQAIVAKLATGELSPNAAAIAAGMREQYIRISPSPPKAAKGLVAKQSKEWCLELLEELSSLVLDLPA
jgi:hypothetical protein